LCNQLEALFMNYILIYLNLITSNFNGTIKEVCIQLIDEWILFIKEGIRSQLNDFLKQMLVPLNN